MADAKAPGFAARAVAGNEDVSISNMLVFNWIRARLIRIPLFDRPETRWFVCGREVHFDNDLRSRDAWCYDTDLWEKALEDLIEPPIW